MGRQAVVTATFSWVHDLDELRDERGEGGSDEDVLADEVAYVRSDPCTAMGSADLADVYGELVG